MGVWQVEQRFKFDFISVVYVTRKREIQDFEKICHALTVATYDQHAIYCKRKSNEWAHF